MYIQKVLYICSVKTNKMAIKRNIVLLMVMGLFTSCATQRVKYVTYVPDSVTVFEVIKAEGYYLDIPKDNKIEVLSLTNSGLDRIPSSVKRCKHLKRLNLEGNHIKHVPRWLTSLDSLEEINLNFNKLNLKKRDIRRLAKVEDVLLAGNGIKKLPDNVGMLRCESLNLSKNQISSLPRSFAELKQARYLIFYDNAFESIPEELVGFKNLKHLDFYKNKITEIPDFIGDMDNLQQLFLSFNKIEEIPDTLRNLKRLKYFYIHHNELHFIPEWITEMDSIERFGVGFNHLLDLPDLSKMKALYEFDAEHNLLERFPWELVEKPEMEILILRDNDFALTDEERMRLIQISKTMNINY